MDSRKAIALALATSLAIPAEGLRQYAYYDPVGILTTCYGSTTSVLKSKFYSLDECLSRLDGDMKKSIDTVERCVPGLRPTVLAAFADAVYNMGPKIACDTKNSTAARLLKLGSIVAACEQLPRWNKARVAGVLIPLPGLTNRRDKEMQLCLT